MFGYVIPYKEKLTQQQWADYRATYCGLCHTMKRRYGFWAQFFLNYDFTFLAILLRHNEQMGAVRCRKCLASPLKGRNACDCDDALAAAADCSVLLVYWKLKDQLMDESFVGSIPARLLLLALRSSFKKAANNCPELHKEIGHQLSALRELELGRCDSIDRTADCFAGIMTAMVPKTWDEQSKRSMEQLLYHLGRWIYLVDAWDDLGDDLKHGQYNPIASRFFIHALGEEALAKERIERTLLHSENLAISAFHLSDYGANAPLIENVLCAGLQCVRALVFSGQWKKQHRQKKQELKHYE